MTGIKHVFTLSLALFFITIIGNNSAIAAGKQAGKTLLTRGSVISKRAGAEVALKRRSNIFEKDEIHVGSDARAQFRMIDQALISLQENSVLQIKKYQYAKGNSSNSALLELLSGGLRTITGAIGKGNKKAYELRTPLATIGIRGTDYEVEIVSNGMYVAVWDGVIHLRARKQNGCNILLGRSQPFMFIFIDQLGKCTGFNQVPDVFKTGHSSNILVPRQINSRFSGEFVAGKTLQTRVPLQERGSAVNPLFDIVQEVTAPLTPTPLVVNDPVVNPPVINPPVEDPPVTPALVVDHNAFVIDQSRASTELDANASVLNSSAPIFKVGLNLLENNNGAHTLDNFTQSVGGYKVSWDYWGSFDSSLASKNILNPTSNGLIWATYESSDPAIVNARTGSFRYDNIIDSLMSGSAGTASNLNIQMDVNFDSGDVTNGALSVNTPSDTWVAVFDGKVSSGDLNLQMNGASVINSDPNTVSPARDAEGFIAGDFVGENAQAIIGAFGLSEKTDPSNHVEGVFVVEEK